MQAEAAAQAARTQEAAQLRAKALAEWQHAQWVQGARQRLEGAWLLAIQQVGLSGLTLLILTCQPSARQCKRQRCCCVVPQLPAWIAEAIPFASSVRPGKHQMQPLRFAQYIPGGGPEAAAGSEACRACGRRRVSTAGRAGEGGRRGGGTDAGGGSTDRAL